MANNVRETGLMDIRLLEAICRTELDPRDRVDGSGVSSYLVDVVEPARKARRRNITMETTNVQE